MYFPWTKLDNSISLLNWSGELAAKWQFSAPYLFTICDFHINFLILKIKTWGFFLPPLSLFPSLPELQGKSKGWKWGHVLVLAAEMVSAWWRVALPLQLCCLWCVQKFIPTCYGWATAGRNSLETFCPKKWWRMWKGKERIRIKLAHLWQIFQPKRLHFLGKCWFMEEATIF